jgi:hypothetical protein
VISIDHERRPVLLVAKHLAGIDADARLPEPILKLEMRVGREAGARSWLARKDHAYKTLRGLVLGALPRGHSTTTGQNRISLMGVGSCLQVYGLSALPDEPRNFHEEGFSDLS